MCLVLANCRHNIEEEPTPVLPCQYDSSIDEMKKWYYFEEGTQWIYQAQTTGELDTATVYDSNEGDTWFDYYVFHSKGGWIVNYYFDTSRSIYCLTSKQCTCHKVYRARGKPGNYVGEGGIFVYPHIVGNYNNLISSNGNEGGRTTSTDLYDSIDVAGQSYLNVVRWEVAIDGSMGDVPAHYFISSNTGIIKMEFPESNEIWSLLSYSIIQ